MKILAVSDLRVHDIGLLEAVADQVEADLILYAGDDVGRFGPGRNSWSLLAQTTPLGLAGVLGNDCTPSFRVVFRQWGCWDLDEEPMLLDDFAVLGLGGSPADEEGRGPNLYTAERALVQLEDQVAKAGNREILLVSHTPPRGVLDQAIRFGVRPIGSTVVREFIRRHDVAGVVCGHVHSQGGRQQTIDGCLVVNVASDDSPRSAMRYAVLEWDYGSLTCTLDEHRPSGAGGPPRPGSLLDVVSQAKHQAQLENRPVPLPGAEPFPRSPLYLDVETSLSCDDAWLVGMKCPGSGKVTQFRDRELRPEHFQRIDGFVTGSRHRVIARWGSFDRAALEKSYRGCELPAPSWLNNSGWRDTNAWVRRTVAMPLRTTSLKPVAEYLGYQFAHPDVDGMAVGGWYRRWKDTGEDFDVDAVCEYNRDDVLSIEYVIHAVWSIVQARSGPDSDRSKKRSGRGATAWKERAVDNLASSFKRLVGAREITKNRRATWVAGFEAAIGKMGV